MVRYDTQSSVEFDSGNLFYVGTGGDVSPTDNFYHFDLFMFKDGSRYSIVDLFQLSDVVVNEPMPGPSAAVQGSSSTSSDGYFFDEDGLNLDADFIMYHHSSVAWDHRIEIV